LKEIYSLAQLDSMPPHPALQAYARSLAICGRRLFFYDSGELTTPNEAGDSPLVLLHGLADEADTWRGVLPALARHRRVIAPDLPGFGRSTGPRTGYTLAFFARTIADLLAGLSIGRATLVGHSLGAAIAQRLALAQPSLVERLALIDGGLPTQPRRPPAQLWLFLMPGLGEAIYTSLRRSQQQAYDTLRPYYADLDGLPEEERAFLRERVTARVWSASQRRAFLSSLRWLAVEQAARADTYRARLARMVTPTRVIWGEDDRLAPVAAAAALAELLPHAQLRVVSGGGHNLHQEQPEALLELLEGI
jgi:pimeloyl-ACP methyl ester carboxylesterase